MRQWNHDFCRLWCAGLIFACVSQVSLAGSRDEARAYQIDDLTLFGIARQGGWLKGQVNHHDRLEFLGHIVKLSKQGKFILGLPYQSEKELVLMRTQKNRKSRQYRIAVEQRDYPIQRINGLLPKKVTPPESEWARIAREAKRVKRARQHISGLTGFDNNFIWPVKGRISGKYGVKRILNGIERSPHYGIDIVAAKGTPVLAPAVGKVVLVHPGMYFSGKTMVIDHGHGLFSSFLHLDKIILPHGSWVRQGQIIGTVGSSGRSTGAHLDWRVNWGSERLDAALFVPPP